jgi:hypothetical protein
MQTALIQADLFWQEAGFEGEQMDRAVDAG